MKVYSVEARTGHAAYVQAENIEEVRDTLDMAMRDGRGALLKRIDGEPIVIYPQHVYLIGEPSGVAETPA